MTDVYENLDNFDFILEAIASEISNGKVIYKDASGAKKSIRADSIVLYAGLKPKQEDALRFYSSAKNAFFTIGDCTGEGGSVQRVIRNAFFTASQI